MGSLAEDTHDQSHQTTLRRAFHTLKGSSRMVGLNEFGEAAWAMEQLLNTRLAEQTPVDDVLQGLSHDVLGAFGRWVEAIATQRDAAWRAATFVAAAEALRTEGRRLELVLPDDVPAVVQTEPVADFADTQSSHDLSESLSAESARAPLTDFGEIDFAGLVSVSEATMPAPLGGTAVPDDLERLFAAEPYRETQPPATGLAPQRDERTVVVPAASAELPAQQAPEPMMAKKPVDAEPAAPLLPEPQGDGPADKAVDEPVKVIGPLHIAIPLFNVYLNEADEWSRRLVTELGEWALELHQPMPDSTIALAHSLAGSSGAVGFHALSELARSLEHALSHVQVLGYG
ncbi:MAG: Hpt domain-containing protein, partial [Rhodoferax sp.]